MNLYCHVTEDTLISEMSKFEAEESEKGVNRQIGVITKNQFNKSLFFKENFPQLIFQKQKSNIPQIISCYSRIITKT